MRVETVSVDSVMVYLGDIISEDVLDLVQNAYHALKHLNHIIDLTPSYTSVLVQYDIFKYDSVSIKEAIKKQLLTDISRKVRKTKEIEIPVDYSKGDDLQRVADLHNMRIEDVISKHTQETYRVYAIGFMVGFAYLANVDTGIQTPRLDTPRTKVPKGSVAIAESQTAIYPQKSAGGWNIIGHTEFDAYDSFEIGDSVRFIAI